MNRKTTVFLITLTLLLNVACYSNLNERSAISPSEATDAAIVQPAPAASANPKIQQAGGGGGGGRETFTAGSKAENQIVKASAESQLPAIPLDRKIIRNGELAIEMDDPVEGQREVNAIAESLGGYVVTSESQQASGDTDRKRITVRLTLRVPSSQFAAAVEKIRATGARVLREKVTGQDVTEEFIDIEAHMKAKKALELQFMEIMKRAQKVEDALEVQRQISEVRGEIEQLEGRRRFLENQSSLSTINVSLQPVAPLLANSPTGFGSQLRSAFGDGLSFAMDFVLGLTRIIVALLPIALILGAPAWLLWHFALRRILKNLMPKKAVAPTLQP